MTQTRKFSQFFGPSPIMAGDIVVGLRNGENWQFTGVGSGGGSGAVTLTFTQISPTLILGNWVRINSLGEYVQAQADTPEDAEVIGVIIATPATGQPANTYILQQSGYITAVQAVFSGLGVGVPQFLSDSSPGQMVPMDVLIDGEVSRPVFVPDTAASGWVLPYRGIIVSGGPDTGTGGGGSGTDSNIRTVTQNAHGFAVGQWLYVTIPSGGQAHYALAIATSLATSQSVGVVTAVTTNTFNIQFAGYNTGAIFPTLGAYTYVDGGVVTASTVYYLSATFAGNISSVNPSALGTFSKPLYVSEQTSIGATSTGIDSGWVLPQRPLNPYVANPNSSPWIFLGVLDQANGFSSDTILTGPYHAYWIIFNSTIGPLQISNGGAPSGFGLQIRSGGVWAVGNASAYMDGVNSTAGVNTATWWGYVRNTISPNSMLVAPPLVNQPELGFGFCLLVSNNGFGNVSGETDFANYAVLPAVGYTCDFSSAMGIIAAAQGLRLVVEGPGAFIPGSGFYITVYGVPNS